MSRQPTQFTRESAERIANVVRAAELTPRAGRPLAFDKVDDPPRLKVFRICTFTGSWSIGSTNTVTIGTSPNTSTVQAFNLFFPLMSDGNRTGAIAKEGTAWYLIDVPFTTATITQITTATAVAVLSTAPQNVVTDVQISAVLNTSNCVITVSKTATTSSIVAVTATAVATVIASTATAVVVRF